MAKKEFPSDKLAQYIVRFPDGMRDRIKEAAAANGRSMNAEIIYRLQTTLEMDAYESKENINSDKFDPAHKADIKIKLDTNGIPVDAHEAMLHLSQLISKAALETISIEVEVKKIRDTRSPDQRDDDFLRVLGKYRVLRGISEADLDGTHPEDLNASNDD